MPSGDAQRQWFPEMIEMLREQWDPELTWVELALLAARLDAVLAGIRKERSIQPPMFHCPKCGKYGRSAFSGITVNATVFAAGRFGIAPEAEAKGLSRRWTKYRKEHHLDGHGKKEATTG